MSSNASLRETKAGTIWCRRKLQTSSAAAVSSDTRNIKALSASGAAFNRQLMLYFAYGSNMDWAQMKQRCPLAKFVCRAKLPAHRLAFTLKSARRDCGVADVAPDQAKAVWSVVYELPDNELKNLDKREDYRPGKPYQSEYTREDHYVWREGDAKQPLLVALYRGHPQLDPRSEEHTSELQSRFDLVCRL